MHCNGYLDMAEACKLDGFRQAFEWLAAADGRAGSTWCEVRAWRFNERLQVGYGASWDVGGVMADNLVKLRVEAARNHYEIACGDWFESTVRALLLFGSADACLRLWFERGSFGAVITTGDDCTCATPRAHVEALRWEFIGLLSRRACNGHAAIAM